MRKGWYAKINGVVCKERGMVWYALHRERESGYAKLCFQPG
jgi:hypothetical protein